jgi:hypothetical protein
MYCFSRDAQLKATLLDGTNVRLNLNIESENECTLDQV